MNLFFEFLKIGALSFGGGMGTLPYFYEMAKTSSLITEEIIKNMLAVSQVTPGPLACNMGTIVGFKDNGIIGSIICNIGFIIPAIVFMGLGYKFLKILKKNKNTNEIIKIVRASALAILITSSINLFKTAFINDIKINNLNDFFMLINYKSIFILIGLYFLLLYKKINTVCLIFISGIISVIIGL